ncbi:DEAD/DEAH box helicase [Nocardia camponoti]|uniref:ATP-dependent helicase n=1 Tax=Nocardia camponoti TaxID=1616106 RepID=A0A917QTJ5_9NOCA|nr:DEAD/DEAH box helicase [Nocardia camponoti]GGK66949.1 ATP-dependent helicase [Nocardia camponoti]
MSDVDRLDPVVVHHIVNTLGWPGLRPLQEEAIAPILAGEDAVLLAPTAGGKTEAACFPVLSAMSQQEWTGISVLYLCPLKALLNNLVTRVDGYAQWLGRRAELWHGDVTDSRRNRIRRDPPDILLTTPESLEAMLIGTKTDHNALLGGVRAVVIDEVHAFAGDDRGWHLLAVLERLQRVTGKPIQRIGLSATVGNPAELLTWLQGSGAGVRAGRVIAPGVGMVTPGVDGARPDTGTQSDGGGVNSRDSAGGSPADVWTEGSELAVARESSTAPPPGDIELDYVGSLENAAKVISALHRGEKRLVFCDSRRQVEELGAALRTRGVTVFLSHASLSVDERTRAEQAFAEARDCVIVSTSTLELGIDVGDLDRVIQIDSPTTVASFLQRLGRTGRRADSVRNCLFLATTDDALVQAAGMLVLWGRGWVEPIVPPPEPRHLVAQQLLAVTLQRHSLGDRIWADEWNGLSPFDISAAPILAHLVDTGHLDSDTGLLHIGPTAEKRYGKRHFLELTAAFTAPPQFTVLAGRQEVGHADPSVLTDDRPGPRLLLLAGRSWRVTYIDWTRRRAFVEPADSGGVAKWSNIGLRGLSFELSRAIRDVLVGVDPPVSLTKRAIGQLADIRATKDVAFSGATILEREGDSVRWWTWAGFRANATLSASLSAVVDPTQRPSDFSIRMRPDLTRSMWRDAVTPLRSADASLTYPHADERAARGLKFSDVLPESLAAATVSARLADVEGARKVLSEKTIFRAS